MASSGEEARKLRFSNRENSEFKWKEDKTVIGALEVKSEPYMETRAHMNEKEVLTFQDEFAECLKIWKEHNLHKSFCEAFDGLPKETRCCGMVNDDDRTVKKAVPLLNAGWAKKISAQHFESKGYKVETFVWSWSNPTGKAETVILLIRFHHLTKSRQ